MQYDVEIDGRPHTVVVSATGDGFAVTVDGRSWHVDAAPIDRDLVSLLIRDVSPKGDIGQVLPRPSASHEVAFGPDRGSGHKTVILGAMTIAVALNGHRRRKDEGRGTGSGPQRLVSPMPGKIVRLLVKPGDVVHARQPLVVVEAMKMENELRAGSDGKVAEVLVNEGASVDAGALLVVIE